MPQSNVYFASEPESRKAADAIQHRIENFRQSLRRSGKRIRINRAINTYSGRGADGNKDTSRLTPAGEQGELLSMTVNHFASLLQNATNLITSSRPAYKAIAANSDYSSLAQTQLADGLLEFYDRNLQLGDREVEATRNSLLMGEGFIALSWNPSSGRETGLSVGGREDREGDIESSCITIDDVAYEPRAKDYDLLSWIAFKTPCCRADLEAKYPAVADKIKNTTAGTRSLEGDLLARHEADDSDNDDYVDVWEFRHKPTPGCPNGRLIRFINPDCVLFDTFQWDELSGAVVDYGYPYDELHVYRMTPDTEPGSISGHSPFFDLVGLQEGIDMVATIAATATNASGLFNLWVPPGEKVNVDQIAGGLNVIQSNTKPEVILPPAMRPETREFAAALLGWMRQRTGINEVVQGEYTKGMPAQAMALLQANAIQFHSKLQQSYQRMVERVRTGILQLLKRYASTKRVALMAGVGNTWQLREFTKEDLLGVDRVIVEAVNPQSKTFAGNTVRADKLMDMGLIKDPQQYITFTDTGNLKPMTDSVEKRNAFVQRNKELLQRGIGLPPVDPYTGDFVHDGQEHVTISIADTHWLNIPEYDAVMYDPGARTRPDVVRAVNEVRAYSFKLWRSMDPAMILIHGGFPCPPLADPAMVLPPDGKVGGQSLPPSANMTQPPAMGEQSSTNPAPLPGLEKNMNGQRMPSLPQQPEDPLGRQTAP